MELNLLPLVMQLELNDMMFFIRCLKEPTEAFRVSYFVTFCTHSTQSSIVLLYSLYNNVMHFYSAFDMATQIYTSKVLLFMFLILTAEIDYVSASEQFTFDSSVSTTQVCLSVVTLEDELVEDSETLVVAATGIRGISVSGSPVTLEVHSTECELMIMAHAC